MARGKIFEDGSGGIPFQMRFDKVMHERLRKYAFDKKVAMAEFIRSAVKEKLDSIKG